MLTFGWCLYVQHYVSNIVRLIKGRIGVAQWFHNVLFLEYGNYDVITNQICIQIPYPCNCSPITLRSALFWGRWREIFNCETKMNKVQSYLAHPSTTSGPWWVTYWLLCCKIQRRLGYILFIREYSFTIFVPTDLQLTNLLFLHLFFKDLYLYYVYFWNSPYVINMLLPPHMWTSATCTNSVCDLYIFTSHTCISYNCSLYIGCYKFAFYKLYLKYLCLKMCTSNSPLNIYTSHFGTFYSCFKFLNLRTVWNFITVTYCIFPYAKLFICNTLIL